MKTQQKALIVKTGASQAHCLDELNIALSRGWRVVHVVPMGGAGVGAQDGTPELCLAALVIVERAEEEPAGVLVEAEEEVENLLDEIAEGDGASADVADGLDEELP